MAAASADSAVDFIVIIPARYASVRLPGKPLENIAGKPMIQHVYERAIGSGASQVIIATDDKRIQAAAENIGAPVCMTSSKHTSGTDRISEVADKYELSDEQIIVNLQGDELFMPPALIRQVAKSLAVHINNDKMGMTTLRTPIETAEELFDTNVVKVVVDKNENAIYFSRAPIPWDRDTLSFSSVKLPEGKQYFRHIGIYAHSRSFLKRYVNWVPAPIETTESLEQLRVLWNDYTVHVPVAEELPFPGVDTPEDLEKAILKMKKKYSLN